MDIRSELEEILFHYGFQECRNKADLQFSKLNDTDYLLIKFFGKHTADLFFAKFYPDQSPCNTEPIDQETLKLSFTPKDVHVLKPHFSKK